MADRYQDRNFMADDLDRGSASRGPARSDSDPLAELARLIGQNDPFAGVGRAGPKVQVPPRAAPAAPEPVARAPEPAPNDPLAAAGAPPWMQRGAGRPAEPLRQPPPVAAPAQDFQDPVHPLHRYGGAGQPAPQQQAFEEPAFHEEEEHEEPSRYDDALFGQLDQGGQDFNRDQGFAEDPYAFEEEDGYDDGEDEDHKRGGGLAKVLMVLTLAVVGTGGAFAYRAYVGSPQGGEPPIIRADNSPTKIMSSPADVSPKVPDRLGMSDRTEKMVSREETPVDMNTRSGGPRVVFPQMSQGSPAAPQMNVATNDPPPPVSAPAVAAPSSGTMANGEPRRIKTLSVRGDQGDAAATAAPATPAQPMTRSMAAKPGRKPPASANASADAPMSLSPQAAAPAETKMAATNAMQGGADTGVTPTNGYLVQVSSQRSETDAQTSYRALQTKFPDVLGQRAPVIKRADLGEKGIYYRAMVGPFGTSDEAVQMCNNLKTAGGQCVVQKK
jgi:hypothetical protein